MKCGWSRVIWEHSGGKLNFLLRVMQVWNRKRLWNNLCGKQKCRLLHILHMTSHTIALGQNTTIIETEPPAQHSAQMGSQNKNWWMHLYGQPLTISPTVTDPLFIFLSASKYRSRWDLSAHLKFKTSASLNSYGCQHESKSSPVMYRAMSRFYLGPKAAVRCIETECIVAQVWEFLKKRKKEKTKSEVCNIMQHNGKEQEYKERENK